MRKAIVCAVLSMAAAVPAASGPAMAADDNAGVSVSPNSACPNGAVVWEDEGDTYTWVQASGNNARVSGDPGVTLGISTTTSYSETGSISVSSGITVSDVITTVKTDVGVTISQGYSMTTSSSGSWTVPASYTNGGALAIGARKHKGSVQKWQANVNCAPTTLLSSSSYKAPEVGWYFKHFQL